MSKKTIFTLLVSFTVLGLIGIYMIANDGAEAAFNSPPPWDHKHYAGVPGFYPNNNMLDFDSQDWSYTLDWGRIVAYRPDGTYSHYFAASPQGMADFDIDASDRFWTMSTSPGNRIVQIDTTGTEIASYPVSNTLKRIAYNEYVDKVVAISFSANMIANYDPDSNGSIANQSSLYMAGGDMVVDNNGNVIVARCQSLSSGNADLLVYDYFLNLIGQATGVAGSCVGINNHFINVDVDSEGKIWTTHSLDQKVRVFNFNGGNPTLAFEWTAPMNRPMGIRHTADEQWLGILDGSAVELHFFGEPPPPPACGSEPYEVLSGGRDGYMIDRDNEGNYYALNEHDVGQPLTVWDSQRTLLRTVNLYPTYQTQVGALDRVNKYIYIVDTNAVPRSVQRFDEYGNDLGVIPSLASPQLIATDGDGNLYVADYVSPNMRLKVFNPAGGLIRDVLWSGSPVSWSNHRMAVDPLGQYLYVTRNMSPYTVEKIDATTGALVDTLPFTDWVEIMGVVVGPSGHIFIAGSNSDGIGGTMVWDPTMTTLLGFVEIGGQSPTGLGYAGGEILFSQDIGAVLISACPDPTLWPSDPSTPQCVIDAANDSGIPVEYLEYLDIDWNNACDNDLVLVYPENHVQTGSTKLPPFEILFVGNNAELNGSIRGDGSQTVILGDGTLDNGTIKNIRNVLVTGNSVIKGGLDGIENLIIMPGASLAVSGSVEVNAVLYIGQNSLVDITGELYCEDGTDVTQEDPSTVHVGVNECVGVEAVALGTPGYNWASLIITLLLGFGVGLIIDRRRIMPTAPSSPPM
jgi:sugar lactone lactonase YvrE